MSEKKKPGLKFDIKEKLKFSGSEKKKNTIRSTLVLFVLALSSAILLSGLNEVMNADERNKTDADMVEVMHRILPASEYKITETEYKKTEEIHAVYEAYNGEELIGYCVEVEVKDHMDTLSLAVAIDRQNTVCAVEITDMSENAGTGIKVKDASFLDSFKGKNSMITANKGTPKDNSHISVISGATISSKAVTKGVNEAIAAVSQIEAEKANPEGSEEPVEANEKTEGNNEEGEVQAE